MRNPYDVLGVPQGAAIEQVNAAYRELMRKYQDSGNQKKIDEINEAYDSIVMGAPSGGSGYSSGGYSQYGAADYSDIRAKINSGRRSDFA